MSKNKPHHEEKRCELCEIIIEMPKNFVINQICAINSQKLLIIFGNGENNISYIANYTPSKHYIFRDKNNAIVLTTDSVCYKC